MKIKPFKLRRTNHEYKPLIFIGVPKLPKPKIPLKLIAKVHEIEYLKKNR